MNSYRSPFHFYAILFATGLCLGVSYPAAYGQQTSPIHDKDGNSYTIKTMSDNKVWMTMNLATNIPGSYCYEHSAQHCKDFGRLYTWKAAQEGCSLLGAGWRLPSLEEWEQLAKPYGGSFNDSKDSGRSAFKALLQGGHSGFNAVLGGGRDEHEDKYGRINGHGFYWTATPGNPNMAWFANFGKGSQRLYIQKDGELGGAFAVRCIKDAGDGETRH